ncbi:MAG: carbamoyl phosphate synthase large subunit, partial [Rhodobacteraceae bacterium]
MPKREDLSSILIIGAGPIIIGQACEFDYSGTQACKALKEEGFRVILINSNPATIMTDPNLADATYIEPITIKTVEKIIIKEKPDAILPTMGGQTALNIALELHEAGLLTKYDVELIGATKESIEKAEDRKLFRDSMAKIGIESPRSSIANNLSEAKEAIEEIGLPVIIRPAFTMGGTGGGIVNSKEKIDEMCLHGLLASPVSQILIDESLVGWKEFEMEVVRDKADNTIIVCSIENVDPMGVHTGDSITVAPALTLTDREYQVMRNLSMKVLREIGVETGGSNVQWAINPKNGRMVIIEMNPRVSRSSALASKATGFPIAKIATKLAIGFTLDELTNDITKVTPASFEPTLDYVVTKIPRFTFEKFPGSSDELTTSMKSVGEVMAIGSSFCESLQKAISALEIGLSGIENYNFKNKSRDEIKETLGLQTPERLLKIGEAIRQGIEISEIEKITGYDKWFLEQIFSIIKMEKEIIDKGIPNDPQLIQDIKAKGFTDKRLANLTKTTEEHIFNLRKKFSVMPLFKRVDTCAAEFESSTPYMYSTYKINLSNNIENEIASSEKEKIVILGGGPNRIGQGIEFDYCCCHACFSLSKIGYETVMINCNPETVSTDFDTSDRLYFEPVTVESVISIIEAEAKEGIIKGVIVQLGGQTPLKIANTLEGAGIPILGTSTAEIDRAEDRHLFKNLLTRLNLKQPKNNIAKNNSEALTAAKEVGFPLVIRPSYVLGGSAMEIIFSIDQLKNYIGKAVEVSGDNPVLLDSYLQNAIELDVDAICDERDVWVAGIMEHIEEAGVHSGDSACCIPPHSIDTEVINEIKRQTKELALALNVRGLINIQFALQGSNLFVLEVNPRASRTVPFVSKAIGYPLVALASRVMAGEELRNINIPDTESKHICVKEAVLPFDR